jgi:hypothetical protein
VKHALRNLTVLAAGTVLAFGQGQQQQRQRIDVQDYTIALKLDPVAQTMSATAKVRFLPIDDVSQLSFELNNALSLDRVTDEQGSQIPASRLQQDMSVRLTLPQPLAKGKLSTLNFEYDGKLTGEEESPVFGIKFLAIHPDVSYLMYPGRWFPVNDYTVDRFGMDLTVTAPAGYKVLASGTASTDGNTTHYRFTDASFPGSVAVVRGDPQVFPSGGVNTTTYFRQGASMASAYGEEFGRAMDFFSGIYGNPAKKDLTVVETEEGTPNGYAAPGLVFLSPRAIGKEVNTKLVANNVARQWWGTLVSGANRNHIWIENGFARYSELMYIEHVNGAGAMQQEVHDTYVTALTVDQPPLIQSARLEDYSPEFWAATAGKGAAVMHMLRGIVGDEKFDTIAHTLIQRFAWKQVTSDDFRKVADEIYGQSLNYFFLEWVESSGAPEFSSDWSMLRVSNAQIGNAAPQAGFRVMGKVKQDLDLFRMPMTVHIETEGNPEDRTIEVVGTSSEFSVDTFGKPRPDGITLDPKNQILHWDKPMRVAVAIRKGEQFVEISEYAEAMKEYQKALDVVRNSSLAFYRMAQVYFLQANWNSSANTFHEVLNGDLEPKWTEVWAHINLGKILDIHDERDRALNEYKMALRTKDDTGGALEEAQKYIDHPYQRERASN